MCAPSVNCVYPLTTRNALVFVSVLFVCHLDSHVPTNHNHQCVPLDIMTNDNKILCSVIPFCTPSVFMYLIFIFILIKLRSAKYHFQSLSRSACCIHIITVTSHRYTYHDDATRTSSSTCDLAFYRCSIFLRTYHAFNVIKITPYTLAKHILIDLFATRR